MGCNKDCQCKGQPLKRVIETHALETIIGPVMVLGLRDEDTLMYRGSEIRKGLEELSRDNGFWLKFHDVGITHVVLHV